MRPISRKERAAYNGGPKVSTVGANAPSHDNIDELRFLGNAIDSYNEDGDMSFIEDEKPKEPKKMTDEEIKIKAINLAINIAKLMADVSVDDVLEISGKVALYIKK